MVSEVADGRVSCSSGHGAGQTGLDGVDGYPHRWFGAFPSTAIGRADLDDLHADGFAASLAELVLTVKREGSVDEVSALDVITQGAVAVITGAQHCAVVVPDGAGQLAARSVHGDLPPRLMALQNELGEGPCLDAVAGTTQVKLSDVWTDPRWPRFGEWARTTEARSLLCTPLAVQSTIFGSLSLISTEPDAFDQETEVLAAVFAAHAALALANVQEVRHLKAMALGRDLIGQAKGILMERHKLTAEQAFDVLVYASQRRNVKVRELCQELTVTGVLPDLAAGIASARR